MIAGRAYESIRQDRSETPGKGNDAISHRDAQKVKKSALVVGGGPAGLSASLCLARNGADVVIVEKSDRLGGNLPHILSPEIRSGIEELISKAEAHPRIRIFKKAEVLTHEGITGRFSSCIRLDSGEETKIAHGAAVLAMGGNPAKTNAYGLGSHDQIITQLELSRRLDENGSGMPPKTVVMIQCAGCREAPQNFCSRICCTHALQNAVRIREMDPKAQVYVFYRDIMTMGNEEQLYTEARQKGVLFIPFDKDDKPTVSLASGNPEVIGYDPVMGEEIRLQPDLVVLSTGVAPAPAEDLSEIFRIELTEDGFLKEADTKWRPVDTMRAGVFAAGLGRAPLKAEAAMREGEAAAYRALRILNRKILLPNQVSANVKPALCSGCQVCIPACPYAARYLDALTGKAMVDAAACQGCGACVAACPNKASYLLSNEDAKITELIEEIL